MVNAGQTAGTIGSIIGMGIGLSLLAKTAKDVSKTMSPTRRGQKDASQRGRRSGGRRRNRTTTCRHPRTRSIRSRHTLKPKRSIRHKSTGSLNMKNVYKW